MLISLMKKSLNPMTAGLFITALLICTAAFQAGAVKRLADDAVAPSSANDTTTLFNLGLVYYQKGEFNDAIPPLKKVIAINPADEMAYVLLGIIYLNLESFPEAEKYLKEALRINSKNVDAFNNLSLVYYKQKRFDDAIDQLRQALAVKPNNADTLTSLASIYREMGKIGEAIQEYKRILQANPKAEKVINTLAGLYFQTNHPGEVIKLYGRVDKKITASSDAQTNLGFASYYVGDFEQAAKYFTYSNKINSGKAETHYGLGLISYRAGNLEAAIKEFRKALTLKPRYPEVLQDLSNAYEDQGEYIKALYFSRQLLKILSNDVEARQRDALLKKKAIDYYLKMGSKAYFDGDFKSAMNLWGKVLKLDPNNANAEKFITSAQTKLAVEIKKHNVQAESHYLQKRYKDAYSEWQHVLKLNPENENATAGLKKLQLKQNEKSEVMTAQGLNYVRNGKVRDALEEFRTTLKTDPNNLVAKQYVDKLQNEQKSQAEQFYRKGVELLSRGNMRESISNLEQALEINPKDQRTKNLLYKARTQLRDNIKALMARGVELANGGRVSEAKGKFNEVLKMDPGNADASDYLSKLTGQARASVNKEEIKKLYYEGVSLYLDGQNRRAIEMWQKILLLDPENQEAKSSIAKAQMELKEMEKRGIRVE